MKRFIIAIAVFGALAAAAIGSAATVSVSGGTLQVGRDDSLVCDADRISVAGYATSMGGGQNDILLDWINVTGIDAACAGNQLKGIIRNGTTTLAYVMLPVTPGASCYTMSGPAWMQGRPDNVGLDASETGTNQAKLCVVGTNGLRDNSAATWPLASAVTSIQFELNGPNPNP